MSDVIQMDIDEFFAERNLLVGDRLHRGIAEFNQEGKRDWFWSNPQMLYPYGCYKLPDGRILIAALGYPWNWEFSFILVLNEAGDVLWYKHSRQYSNPHEARVTPRDTILIPCCFTDRVIEIDGAGNIIWQWFAADYYKRPKVYREGITNWTHINDSIPLKNGNVMLSLRNFSKIIEVDYKTKEVVWEFGKGILDHQHRLQELANGNLMIADSENHRVIELKRGPGTDWNIEWEFAIGPSDWVRSGIRYEDLNIIATSRWDWKRKGDGLFGNTWVSEDWILIVTMEKEVVWKLHLPMGFNIYSAEPCKKVEGPLKGSALISSYRLFFRGEP